MKKKLFVTLLITFTTLLCSFACANAEDNINVILNDEVVTFDTAPVMENDRILVPIRAIAEKMKFNVDWNQETQTVTLENDYNILTLQINDYKIKKEHKFIPMNFFEGFTKEETQEIIDRYNKYTYIDVPSKVINDRTYLPLRAISELFGADVDWIQDTQTAKIFYAHSYGEEITFEDDGISNLTKLILLVREFRISVNDVDNDLAEEFCGSILENETLFNKLSKIKLYKGDLNNVTSLSLGNYIFPEIEVYSLEDIKKFTDLKSISIEANNIKDLTPLTHIKDWESIHLANCPINLDFTPLYKINITDNFYVFENYIYFITYEPNDSFTFKDFVRALEKISSKLQSVIDENIDENMTRTEKITAINNWICENVEYDRNYEHLNSEKLYLNENNIECAVLYGYAVCQGYAETFNTLCKLANIPCTIVHGTAYGIDPYGIKGWGGHAWNLVQLEDGNFYHVDPTWNNSPNKYLLLTDEELEEFQNHIWDKDEANEDLEEYLLYLESYK